MRSGPWIDPCQPTERTCGYNGDRCVSHSTCDNIRMCRLCSLYLRTRMLFQLRVLFVQARRLGFENEWWYAGESLSTAAFPYMMWFIAICSEGFSRACRVLKRVG